MTKYVRICKGVNTRGSLVPLENVESSNGINKYIESSPDSDWYRSVYYYGPDAKTYYDTNNNSIKGYDGPAWTNRLVFDLDNDLDPNEARRDTLKLLNSLFLHHKVNILESATVYFSGKKGFHVELLLSQEFTPEELKTICTNMANEIGLQTFDTSIYNTTRIIRLPNSRHQDTSLYKIPLMPNKLSIKKITLNEIKELAKSPKFDNRLVKPVQDLQFLEQYKQKSEVTSSTLLIPTNKEINNIRGIDTIDFSKCPRSTPRCIYALQKGVMVPGEREVIFFRLARYFRNQGYDEDFVCGMLSTVADRNHILYPEHNKITDEEIKEQAVVSAFSDSSKWRQIPGAIGISEQDELLKKYCDAIYTDRPCSLHGKKGKSTVVRVDEVLDGFADFAENFDRNTVPTGIDFIDKYMNISIGTVTLLVGACGCHRKGEKILMYDGSVKNVEDVEVGEQLMGPDSKPRMVLELKRGKEAMYQVTFDKGKVPKNKPKYFNESHKLHFLDSTSGFKNGEPTPSKIKQLTIKDYITKYGDKKYNRHYILRTGIEFLHKDVTLDPYFLGLWLGDGTSSELSISTQDKEIKDYIYYIGDKYNLKIYNKENRDNKCPIYRLTSGIHSGSKYRNNLWNNFKELNLKSNKHIPQNYLSNSSEVRIQLLAGIIDTDGHLHNNVIEIIQKNKRLAYDIQKLGFSLGIQATIQKVTKSSQNGTKGLYYRLHLSGNLDKIPTKLKRKKPTKRLCNKNVNHLSFNVKKVNDNEEYFGFTVDKDNLYLDDDFLITRNSGKTTAALNIIEKCNEMDMPTLFFSLDMHRNVVLLKLATKVTNYSQKQIVEFYKTKNESKKAEIRIAINNKYSNTIFDFSKTMTIEQMRDKVFAAEEKLGKKIKLVVVDYASRISGAFSDRYANATYNALKSVEVAEATDAAWIYISQISRNAGDGSSPLRTKRAAKESGDWEEAASNVITLWRPFLGSSEEDNVIRMYLAKNRMGKEVEEPLYWNGAKAIVRTMTDGELADYKEAREPMEQEVLKAKYNKRIN